jgi:protein-S-isoprenylcysteine O-methyltransferase Ste14
MWLSGAALWMGSVAAVVASLGMLLFLLVRITIEETHLRDSLPGYGDYTTRVRWRLMPFII